MRVERKEAANTPDIVAGHCVVVAGFGVALVAGEVELVVRGVVPGIAEGKVAHLFESVSSRIGNQAIGEMILVIVTRPCAEKSVVHPKNRRCAWSVYLCIKIRICRSGWHGE